MAINAPQNNPSEPLQNAHSDHRLDDPSRFVARASLKDLQKWVKKGEDHKEAGEDKTEDAKPQRAPLLKNEQYLPAQPIQSPDGGTEEEDDEKDEGLFEKGKKAASGLANKVKEKLQLSKTPIDLGKKSTILLNLKKIRTTHFDTAITRVDKKEINSEARKNAKFFLDDLAERMFYVAIVENWSIESLEEIYTEEVDVQRDKAAGGSLVMEVGRKIRRAWNASGSSLSGDSAGMDGMNPVFEQRGNKQLIEPGDIQDVIDDLGFEDIQKAVFDAPLDKADDNEVDSDRREFIENNILPGLGYQVVAKVAVENYPIGNTGDQDRKLRQNFSVPGRLWGQNTEQVELTPREVAQTYALRAYIHELVVLRNLCFVGEARAKAESGRAKEEDALYGKLAAGLLKSWGKVK